MKKSVEKKTRLTWGKLFQFFTSHFGWYAQHRMQGLATSKLLSSATSWGRNLDILNVLQEGFDQIGFSSARAA